MKKSKNILKKSLDWIKKNPRKTIASIFLSSLIATAHFKDNVHLGSVTLINSEGNQYVIGILPKTTLAGVCRGNINTFSLLWSGNYLYEHSSLEGNMNSYSLLVGTNDLNKASLNGNINAYSLFISHNFSEDSKLNGKFKTLGFFSYNSFYHSHITGDLSNKGVFVKNTVLGSSVGSKDIKGLENYLTKF